MSEKVRVPLAQAEALAAELVELLSPVCERLEIAGSIRRRRPDPADIEICAIPKRVVIPEFDMFGNVVSNRAFDLLGECADDLLARCVLEHRRDVNGRAAWGESYRRAIFRGFALDLFSCWPEQWGCLLTIRTGPAEFSHRLVTDTTQRLDSGLYGLKPPWAQVKGLRVLHRASGEVFDTPEERQVFEVLSLPYVEPWERTDDWQPLVTA